MAAGMVVFSGGLCNDAKRQGEKRNVYRTGMARNNHVEGKSFRDAR